MNFKIKPVLFKVHPDFIDLIHEIQELRIEKGKETRKEKVSLWRITKAIKNMIDTNTNLKEALVEVEITDG